MSKSDIFYCVTETKIVVNENVFLSYGLSCWQDGDKTLEIDDISPDKVFVEELAREFTKELADPLEVGERIEKALCE